MEDIEHCCVCLELYSHLRLPTRLSKCGHIVCSSCLSTQAISACPLCRSQLEPSTRLIGDEQLLLSIRKQHNTRMPSPTSFPIGMCWMDETSLLNSPAARSEPNNAVSLATGLLDAEDAPGTPPYPSAPALVEVCLPCLCVSLWQQHVCLQHLKIHTRHLSRWCFNAQALPSALSNCGCATCNLILPVCLLPAMLHAHVHRSNPA
jgi:hypothetical protein